MQHPSPLPPPPPGTRVWLARHAEVAREWRGRAYGDLDVPLSPEGEARSLELARDLASLPPACILSSPLRRAEHLARAAGERAGLAPRLDPGLREVCRGRWQGLAVEVLHAEHADEVRAFYADPWGFRGHGGESDADVCARAWAALAPALAEQAGCVVVATHYNVLRVLAAAAVGIAPVRSFALRVDPGRALLLVGDEHGWALGASNVHAPSAVRT